MVSQNLIFFQIKNLKIGFRHPVSIVRRRSRDSGSYFPGKTPEVILISCYSFLLHTEYISRQITMSHLLEGVFVKFAYQIGYIQ